MLKRLKRALAPNTLIKKCLYGMAALTLAMLLLTSSIVADFFYWTMKPELQHNSSVLLSAVSTKLSYIIHQNSQYLLRFWEDEEMTEDMEQYGQLSDTSDEKQTIYSHIVGKLIAEERGSTEEGAIVSSRDAFVVMDSSLLFASSDLTPYAETIMASQWFQSLPETFEVLKIYNPQSDGMPRCYSPVLSLDQEDFLAFALLKETDHHTFYYIMVEPLSDITTIFLDLSEANITDYALVGFDNQLLFQNKPDSALEQIDTETRDYIFSGEQYETRIRDTSQGSVLAARASYRMDQLKVAAVLDKSELLQPYQAFIRNAYLFLIIFVLLLLVFVSIIIQRSLSPLKILSRQMTEARKHHWMVDRKIQKNDEIGILADNFYSMMKQIQDNLDQLKHQEEEKNEIEYSLLVSQIDPHFIYNTLNTITYLAELNQPDDIMIINNALIEMLRDRLSISKLQIYDTLDNEKRMIDLYITIQKYLCNNEITCTVSFAEEIGKEKYPKNILQPFVENSILHGILLHRDQNKRLIPGFIQIQVSLENDTLVTRIADNGVGMSPEQIQIYFCDLPPSSKSSPADAASMSSHSHIGIYNIRKRLGYLYGERFHIEARNLETGGLELILRFPSLST